MQRVFVCHDHRVVREAVSAALASAGLPVIGESAQGVTGLERLRVERPEVAVVASSPGHSPAEWVARYRDACPGMKVVLLLIGTTTREEPDTGADVTLDPSCRLDGMIDAVRSLVRESATR